MFKTIFYQFWVVHRLITHFKNMYARFQVDRSNTLWTMNRASSKNMNSSKVHLKFRVGNLEESNVFDTFRVPMFVCFWNTKHSFKRKKNRFFGPANRDSPLNVDGDFLRLELIRRKTFLIIVFQNVTKDYNFLRHFLRHFLRQESVVLTSNIEKVCVHVVNNGTEYLCVVPNLYSYSKNIVDSLYLIECTLIESVN